MKTKVAIITRTRNRELLLRRCVQSVLGQLYRGWVHVIVNDGGSMVALQHVLEDFRDAYDGRLEVVSLQRPSGMQAATNAGIEAVDSEFIAIHDDDDAWHPHFLSQTVAFLDEQGADSIYQGVATQTVKINERIEDDRVVEVSREPYQPLSQVNLFRLGFQNPFPPIAFIYRRQVHQELGLFDQRFSVAGDMDFNFRFLQRYEIGVLPEALAYYHWRINDEEGPFANTVTAGTREHARRLNEFQNYYLRGEDPQRHVLGLGLNIAHYLCLAEHYARTSTSLAHGILDALNERFDMVHSDTASVRNALETEAIRKLNAILQQTSVVENVLGERVLAEMDRLRSDQAATHGLVADEVISRQGPLLQEAHQRLAQLFARLEAVHEETTGKLNRTVDAADQTEAVARRLEAVNEELSTGIANLGQPLAAVEKLIGEQTLGQLDILARRAATSEELQTEATQRLGSVRADLDKLSSQALSQLDALSSQALSQLDALIRRAATAEEQRNETGRLVGEMHGLVHEIGRAVGEVHRHLEQETFPKLNALLAERERTARLEEKVDLLTARAGRIEQLLQQLADEPSMRVGPFVLSRRRRAEASPEDESSTPDR